MKNLRIVLPLVLLFAVLFQAAPISAAEEVSCSLSISQSINVLQVTSTFTGAEWATINANGAAVTDTQSGDTKTIGLPYESGPHQTVSLSVNGVECDSEPITIDQWLPPVIDGGSVGGSTVGNLAFMGQGVDDCRFFISSSFSTGYNIDNNILTVTIQKMGENNRPFTVVLESSLGVVPWRVQSDPFLGGDSGWGSEVYNLPYDEVLADTTVESVSLTVSNAITGVQCAAAEVTIR